MPFRAVVFDFNGTLSDDEPILYAIYAEIFAELGRPLNERDYYEHLAGHTEAEIFRRWTGRDDPELIADRIERYRARVFDGSTVDTEVRTSVRYAAARGPVGIVSSAAREEIEPVVAAAGLAGVFQVLVSAEDVTRGKPDPEPYERAARLLGVPAAQTLAFEDSEAGVAAAKGAGMRVVGLTRTLGAERLAAADDLIDHIELAAMERLLA
ncbi:MAG TPA: HAD family phosphatase [Gaiellaceae bacterium]|nr:HAD family phosphatase [Gaiellaceae bacterium]